MTNARSKVAIDYLKLRHIVSQLGFKNQQFALKTFPLFCCHFEKLRVTLFRGESALKIRVCNTIFQFRGLVLEIC